MRKLMYILMAHVLVLGGLWVWRNVYRQAREPRNISIQMDLVQTGSDEEKIRLCLLREDLFYLAQLLRQDRDKADKKIRFIQPGDDFDPDQDLLSCFKLDLSPQSFSGSAGTMVQPLDDVRFNLVKHESAQ